MSHLTDTLSKLLREKLDWSSLTQGRCYERLSDTEQQVLWWSKTHAHCSMFASACNMIARLRFLEILTGSTVFRAYESSRGGISGGRGAFEVRCPIYLSWPVRNSCTACLVRMTYSGYEPRSWTAVVRAHLQHRVRSVENEHSPLDEGSGGILSRDERFRFTRGKGRDRKKS